MTTRHNLVGQQRPELIELEQRAAQARKEYETVAPWRYSQDPIKVTAYEQARRHMRETATAYRRAYRTWERAEKSEAQDRQELSRPNFM